MSLQKIAVPSHHVSLGTKPSVVLMQTWPIPSPFYFEVVPGDCWLFHLHFTEIACRYQGQDYSILPGSVTLFPPHQTYEITGLGAKTHLWYSAHFVLPKADSGPLVPIILDIGNDFQWFERSFHHAADCLGTNRARAEAAVWEMLWQIEEKAALTPAQGLRMHPCLERAVQTIEQRLHEPLTVAGLAQEVGMSHNQLTRLFQSAFGQTVLTYIRERRGQRAHYFLTQTQQPLKMIAVQVGLGDPHQFNKTIRRVLGDSPRAIRETARAGEER